MLRGRMSTEKVREVSPKGWLLIGNFQEGWIGGGEKAKRNSRQVKRVGKGGCSRILRVVNASLECLELSSVHIRMSHPGNSLDREEMRGGASILVHPLLLAS